MSWDSPSRHMGMIPNVLAPPELLATALNGSSFLPKLRFRQWIFGFGRSFLDLSWLPSVSVFWLLIGAILDWKLKHSGWLIRPKSLRIPVFGVLLFLALVLLYGEVSWIRELDMVPFTKYFSYEIRRHGLWAPALDTYLQGMWSIAGIVYFTIKLWNTFVRPQPEHTL